MAGTESKIEMAKIGNLAFLMVTLSATFALGISSPSDIYGALSSSALNIGMHVIALADSGGESLNTLNQLAEPKTILLLSTGLLGLAGISRRKP